MKFKLSSFIKNKVNYLKFHVKFGFARLNQYLSEGIGPVNT